MATAGLASDDERLWASDAAVDAIFVHREQWRLLSEWSGGIPGPIAWDGTLLWVVSVSRRALFATDGETGATVRTIGLPESVRVDPARIAGLAWDSQALWMVTACGLCSSFYRIDPRDGQAIQSFPPFCDARGLAFDEPYLLTIGRNDFPFRHRLISRRVSGDPRSAELDVTIDDLVLPGKGTNPTALVLHGGSLLVAFEGTDELARVMVGARCYPLPAERPKSGRLIAN